jgi:hypothetical protein
VNCVVRRIDFVNTDQFLYLILKSNILQSPLLKSIPFDLKRSCKKDFETVYLKAALRTIVKSVSDCSVTALNSTVTLPDHKVNILPLKQQVSPCNHNKKIDVCLVL